MIIRCLYVFGIILIISCSSNQKIGDRKVFVKEIRDSVDILLYSASIMLDSAFDSESLKINSTKLLIEELNFILKVPPSTHLSKINKVLEELEKNTYTKENFYNLKTMLLYDSLTENLMNLIKILPDIISNFDGYKRSLLFYEEIIKTDKQDFYYRRDYNILASQYNTFLKKYKKEIDPTPNQTLNFFYGDNPDLQ